MIICAFHKREEGYSKEKEYRFIALELNAPNGYFPCCLKEWEIPAELGGGKGRLRHYGKLSESKLLKEIILAPNETITPEELKRNLKERNFEVLEDVTIRCSNIKVKENV